MSAAQRREDRVPPPPPASPYPARSSSPRSPPRRTTACLAASSPGGGGVAVPASRGRCRRRGAATGRTGPGAARPRARRAGGARRRRGRRGRGADRGGPSRRGGGRGRPRRSRPARARCRHSGMPRTTRRPPPPPPAHTQLRRAKRARMRTAPRKPAPRAPTSRASLPPPPGFNPAPGGGPSADWPAPRRPRPTAGESGGVRPESPALALPLLGTPHPGHPLLHASPAHALSPWAPMSVLSRARLWVQVCVAGMHRCLHTYLEHTCTHVCERMPMCRACPTMCVSRTGCSRVPAQVCTVCSQDTQHCPVQPLPKQPMAQDHTCSSIPEDGAFTASQCKSYYCLTFTVQRCFLTFKGTFHVRVCAHCTLLQY